MSVKHIYSNPTLISGNFLPNTDDTYDLGSADNAWQDLFLEGDVHLSDATTIAITAAAHDTAGPALIISAGDTTAGTTADIAGGALTIQGGQGKGTGAGGDIIFQTANAAGSTATTMNSLATALTLSDDLSATFTGDVTVTGNLAGDGETTISTSSNDLHLKPAADIIALGNAGGRIRLVSDSGDNPADAVGISWQEDENNESMTLYYNGSANSLILKSQNVDPIMTFPRVAGTVVNWTGVMLGANDNDNWLDDATHGSGSTTMYIGNETITTSSDSRVKEDITDTAIDAVSLLDKMRIVDFTWNDVNDTSEYGKNYRGKYVGMVAQETIQHAPWIINDQGGGKDCPQCSIGHECNEHLPWHVEYHHLVPTLVKAIQELNKEISILRGAG